MYQSLFSRLYYHLRQTVIFRQMERLREFVEQQWTALRYWGSRYSFRLLCILILVAVLSQKDISLELRFTNPLWSDVAVPEVSVSPLRSAEGELRLASLRPTDAQQTYVERFATTARAEMKKFGIPASITLAQGLLETQSGSSPLATKNNNHFGIKCFSKRCQKGHCRNFSDDSHKDFFRVFDTAWASYRAHSELITAGRYAHLTQLAATDYRSWAEGLQAAGYATDQAYARKLIRLIESLELDRYDV